MLCPPAWGYQRPRRHGRSSALILHDCATSSQAGFSDSSRHQSGHVGAFLAYAEGRECLLHHAATLQPSLGGTLSRTLTGCHRTTTRRQALVARGDFISGYTEFAYRHTVCSEPHALCQAATGQPQGARCSFWARLAALGQRQAAQGTSNVMPCRAELCSVADTPIGRSRSYTNVTNTV